MPVALTIGGVGILLVFAIRAVTPAFGPWSLPNQVQDLLTLSISVIIESLPFVILGILLSILVQVWIPDRWIVKVLPRNPWARRAVISFIGILLPVCECGNVPLARGLMIKGFSVSESMTFLLAAPILNPITIVTTGQAFGFDSPIFLWRVIGGFVVANVVGWLFSRHPDQDSLMTDRFAAECAMPDDHHHGTDGWMRGRWKKSIELFTHEAGTIMPALFIGSLVAGLVQVAVPRAVLLGLGSNPVWSILAMMALAFVISVCSNVDSFFILPFANTFMPGSITAFLVFGPLIDIKMLTLMRTTFRVRVLVILTVVVGLLSALIGLVVNYIA
ncbi:permease [Lacisediminihabitans changchengi]|uniref:Permease n=1 Tax=Lacisediminihabitans changchengi TaxID=2787634 RepID=A0A934SP56_9MICO|nr:permease [Lacisediminihabitans changchengi]MBK4346508.1 permease [Lacisediminihabitans changchengi]